MGVDIIPEKNAEFNFISMDFLMSHGIFYHQDKSRTRATAKNLGWKLKNDNKSCEDCLLGKIRVKNMNKKVNFKASKFVERFLFDISSVRHVSIRGYKFWLKIIDEYSYLKWSFFLKNIRVGKNYIQFHKKLE